MEINIAGTILFCVMTWWLVLLMVLPVGIQRETHPGKGHDAGAPKKANIKIKLLVTTLITFCITGIYLFLQLRYGISIHQLIVAGP